MTFSVVCYSREEGKWGVGVQSRYLSVGSIVPWASAGVGCIATQSYANYAFGPDGLRLLKEKDAKTVGHALIEADPGRDQRQLGIVDSRGNAYAYTGSRCHEYASHIVGENFSVQGNILAGKEVLELMAGEMERSGKLEDRIMKALFAGQKGGGDRRGMQSAAILVVSSKRTFEKGADRFMDLRVEDHREPIKELNRLCGLWKAGCYDDTKIPVSEIRDEITSLLKKSGKKTLEDLLYEYSLENSLEDGKIGKIALSILKGEENPEVP